MKKSLTLRSLSRRLSSRACQFCFQCYFLSLKNCHFIHWCEMYFLLLVQIHVKIYLLLLIICEQIIFKTQPIWYWEYNFFPQKMKESYRELNKIIFGYHVTISLFYLERGAVLIGSVQLVLREKAKKGKRN